MINQLSYLTAAVKCSAGPCGLRKARAQSPSQR